MFGFRSAESAETRELIKSVTDSCGESRGKSPTLNWSLPEIAVPSVQVSSSRIVSQGDSSLTSHKLEGL